MEIKEVPSSIPNSKFKGGYMVIPLAGEYMGESGVVIGVNEPTEGMVERSYLIHFEDIDKKVVLTESILAADSLEFYEGTARIILPAWRGELYNFMKLAPGSWGIYEHDTLPPEKMKHILEEHSFYRRIRGLMSIPKMKDEIIKRMNYSEKEVREIMASIEMKIGYYNGARSKDELPNGRKGHDNTMFSIDENKLIRAVDYCDKFMHTNDKGEITESKDHYPPYMSDYAIMKAIKEAYETAEKIEIPKKKYSTQPNQVLFQGTSKDGLVIQFYYDFDYHEISTAYPVFVDTTNRPDLRHLGDKNKKRQN